MKDLTTQNEMDLLGKIKSFLSISWDDAQTDNKLRDYMISSINRIDSIAGYELDYVEDKPSYDETYINMNNLGRELLLNRIFYMNEKGLDDFDTNYRGEITALYLLGKVKKNATQSQNNQQD